MERCYGGITESLKYHFLDIFKVSYMRDLSFLSSSSSFFFLCISLSLCLSLSMHVWWCGGWGGDKEVVGHRTTSGIGPHLLLYLRKCFLLLTKKYTGGADSQASQNSPYSTCHLAGKILVFRPVILHLWIQTQTLIVSWQALFVPIEPFLQPYTENLSKYF